MEKIIIGICTHNRNRTLDICLEKINTMCLPANATLELVVIDNYGNANAQSVIDKFQNNKYKINYFATKTNSIAESRNYCLEKCLEANPDYIAFIDDDEYPNNNWLNTFYNYINETDADILTGPVISKFVDNDLNEIEIPKHLRKNFLFNLHKKRETGDICTTCATNNVFINAKILKETPVFFDENFNKMSGEDLDFFTRLAQKGHKILWCKEASVNEFVPPNRCTLKYILKRNFNNGYLRIFMKKKYKNINIKNHINTLINILIFTLTLPFSILLGKTQFINNLGLCAFNIGALRSSFTDKTYNFYK